jgi:hypothetical protein
VLQAQFGIVFSHARPLEREAISRAPINTESVPIVDRPPIDHHILGAVSNQIGLLFRKRVASNKKWSFLCGEKGDGIAAGRHWGTENGRKLRIERHDIEVREIHNQIAGRSLPVILASSFQNLIWQPKIFDPMLSDSNISAQCSLFLVIRSFPLLLRVISGSGGRYEYQNEQNKFSNFEGSYPTFLGISFGIGGIWFSVFITLRSFRIM